ncbi:MAG: ATP synthase F1 subunit epsilon [Oscillospiraceae bacterium]|nr:ATP synthase F1 subunit epsilon [Oscillospiraceae bacterium]MBQ2794711.1 ATP synthase F1 subunit epsilon [Oscillospiraceae bacterium]MBQ2998316.1 ATP synthase F1 subunit epsilon [Oscillospiraceae bacterium]MBQ3236304.1 ATP synthase F1 subunit epsilon [Oscillospiraceae bacterium]MBQ3561241.1 ATP synthase F1 subunit epsilon [Oscillospiraceae bacterium]
MSDKTINLKVITPVSVLFEGEAKSFIVKTRGEVGEFAVLADHIPMTASIGIGTLLINLPDGSEKRTTLFGGYCVVQNNNAVIIAEAGEKPEEIDFARAEEAKKRAEERLKGGEGLDRNRAEQALYRSIARLELYKSK